MASENIKQPEFDDVVEAEYVIDADVHIEPTVEHLVPYIHDDQIREWISDRGFPEAGSNWAGSHWAAKYDDPEAFDGVRTLGVAYDGEDIREAADEIGVDMPIVTCGLLVNRYPAIAQEPLKDELVKAYNDYLLEEVAPVDDEVKIMAAIPQWDPEKAVAELERIGHEEDIVSAYATVGPYELMGQKKFDPLFEKLVELDLPLTMHASGDVPRFDPGQKVSTWSEAFGNIPCMQAINNTANMVMTGVFEKYPDLNIVYQEAGVSWVPFLGYRLDELYEEHPEDIKFTDRMHEMGQDYLSRKPSEQIFDNVYCCSQPLCKPDNSKQFQAMLEFIRAEDLLIFSSDWPHHTFDPPSWVSRIMGDDVNERLFHGNAESVYRI